jgi:hypothetical protein
MKAALLFYLACLKDAWAGSLEIANAWSWLLGPLLLLLASWLLGYPLPLPDRLDLYALQFSFAMLASAWIAVFLLRLVCAPPRLYAQLQAKIPTPPRSDIGLALFDSVAWESGLLDAAGQELPAAKVFHVRVKNNADKFLEKCQLVFGQKDRLHYPVSGIFDLRSGEYRDLPVIRMNLRDHRPFMYFLDGPDWKVSPSGPSWLLAPGKYEIRVLSANTSPASLDVDLSGSLMSPEEEWKLAQCPSAERVPG